MQTEYLPHRVYQADRRFEKNALSMRATVRLRAVDRFVLALGDGVRSRTAAKLIGVPRSTLFAWRKRLERGP